MSLRERKKREKWRRIRDAARRQFVEVGFDAATIRSIAAEAEVSPATVLHYGATKAALLHEIWRDLAAPVLDALASPLTGDSLVDDVEAVLGPFLDLYASDVRLARVVVPALPYLEGEALAAHAPLLQRLIAALTEAVRRARGRGEIRGDLPDVEAVRLLVGAYQLVLVELLSPLSAQAAGAGAARASLRRTTAELLIGLAPGRVS